MARKNQKPVFLYLSEEERLFVEKVVKDRVTTITEYIRGLIREDAKRRLKKGADNGD